MKIELLKCMSCWRVVDQFTTGAGCEGCFGKFFKQAGPSKFNILRWFLSNPKHVLKLVITDLVEKAND
jgi:hypothetical protein